MAVERVITIVVDDTGGASISEHVEGSAVSYATEPLVVALQRCAAHTDCTRLLVTHVLADLIEAGDHDVQQEIVRDAVQEAERRWELKHERFGSET